MKSKILNAIKEYNKGTRPKKYGKSICWHIMHDGSEYPIKIIWALANNNINDCNEFHSSYAKRELNKLGFNLLNTKDPSYDFWKKVKKSLENSVEARRERLAVADKKAGKPFSTTTVYDRNPDVVAEVLYRANGVCEDCHKKAPFIRVSGKTPYLEVHHIISLSKNGDDTVENCVALCPNCHRKRHYGE